MITDLLYRPGPLGNLQQVTLLLGLINELRPRHFYCPEDDWYSCPKAPEGCDDDSAGTDCRCGADEKNAEIDRKLAEWGCSRAVMD